MWDIVLSVIELEAEATIYRAHAFAANFHLT